MPIDDLEALRAEEVRLETDGYGESLRRFHDVCERTPAAASAGGQALLRIAHPPLAEAIRRDQERVRAGWKPLHWKVLVSLDPDRLALITLTAVLNAIGEQGGEPDALTVTRLAWRIGYSCWRERKSDAYLGRASSVAAVAAARNKKPSNARARGRAVEAAIDKAKWTQKHIDVRLGAALLYLAIQHSGILVEHNVVKRSATVDLSHEAAVKFMAAHGVQESTVRPTLLPMVAPPVPWNGKEKGGYITFEIPLVKRDEPGIEEALLGADLAVPCEAVNAVQETAWRIKRSMAERLRTAWERKDPANVLPPTTLPDVPELPPKNSVDPETWIQLRWEHEEARRRRSHVLGQHVIMENRFEVCRLVGGQSAIYFPPQLDHRGRLYAVPEIVHPQADDMSRALLEFSHGKPLGKRGAYWLSVWVATLYGHGVDKWPFDKRAAWTHERREAIVDAATRPFDGARFWAQAESPWRFLSAAEEWHAYLREGAGYPSRLPVGMDGTCNGLQHLSALGRDPEGGRWTNLVPASVPQDIYQIVADRLAPIIDRAAAGGDERAREWQGAIDRTLVKQPTMTTPYGVTPNGIRDQILEVIAEKHPTRFKSPWRAANYLAPKIQSAISEVVVKAAKISAWLQDIARRIAKKKCGVRWRVPTGFPVVHERWKEDIERVSTLKWTLQLRRPDARLGIDTTEQVNGIVAHVVHSLDAAHMMKTVLALRAKGLRDFAMVHDSYAVHACDVDVMNAVLREKFIELHEEFTLAEFLKQVKRGAPRGVELLDPPAVGSLDLNDVRRSEYFFS